MEIRTNALARQKRGPSPPPVVACDIGAASGRVFTGWFDDGGLQCAEVHRFSNGATMVAGALRWDVDGLWDGIRTGISAARGRGPGTIRSIAVDVGGRGAVSGALGGGGLTKRGKPAVVAPAAHDTASAVAAVPGEPGTAFVSAGSWTLVGVERPAPITGERALFAGLTNEGGVGGQ